MELLHYVHSLMLAFQDFILSFLHPTSTFTWRITFEYVSECIRRPNRQVFDTSQLRKLDPDDLLIHNRLLSLTQTFVLYSPIPYAHNFSKAFVWRCLDSLFYLCCDAQMRQNDESINNKIVGIMNQCFSHEEEMMRRQKYSIFTCNTCLHKYHFIFSSQYT